MATNASRAARIRWKDPAQRRRQSLAMKGRSFGPPEPPPTPFLVQKFLATLDKHDVDIVATTPSHCYPAYRNSWMVWLVDLVCPDSDQYRRFANDVGLAMFVFRSDPLLPPKQGFKVGVLVGRADRKPMKARLTRNKGK